MFNIVNPFNHVTLRQMQSDSKQQVHEKYLSARSFQKEWQQVAAVEKKKILTEFAELLKGNREELARTLSSEMGKPIKQSLGEIDANHARILFFLDNFESELQSIEITNSDTSEKISFEALGVIGNISAWNYPYFVGTNVILPALLTGNTVLYKPSEFASLTGEMITHLLYKAGVPRPAFQSIYGAGDVGALLLEEDIDGIFFTGSVSTGQKIASAAAKKLMKVGLELGGKDPIYVCADVDIKSAAANVADGAFYNAGQSCCAVERVYVEASIYEEFVKEFAEVVKGFKLGDPMLEDTYIGPLARHQQIPILEAQVKDALEKGAGLLVGAENSSNLPGFFSPTVLRDVDHTMLIMKEESFGPIIGIQSVADDAEAIEKMNDSQYGLTAGTFTQNKSRAEKILAELNAGSVYWNCCDRVSPNLPWSGRNMSGLGSTLSKIGIQTFLQAKAWHLRQI